MPVRRSIWKTSRRALSQLGGLVLPVECAGCGAVEEPLCAGCAEQFAGTPFPVTLSAGRAPPAWAVATYEGRTRRVVVSWKDEGRHDLTAPLADALGAAVLGLLTIGLRGGPSSGDDGSGPASVTKRRVSAGRGQAVLLIPVPSGRRARQRRGADLVLRLARKAAAVLRAQGFAIQVVPALRLGRTVRDQAGLGRTTRFQNVSGAMRLRRGAARVVAGLPCVVVDDIVTTGASALEACRAITAVGGIPIGVAAACATPLQRGLSVATHLH